MSVRARLLLDRCRGALVGHAVGDAIGAAVEFMSREQILAVYGPAGVDGPEQWRNDRGLVMPAGSITDDTQMNLATARGLVVAGHSFRATGITDPFDPVWNEYLKWLASQDEPGQLRYPGGTVLASLRGGVPGSVDEPINDRKGSGGIMRVTPVGLAFRPDIAFEEAAQIAALTHGHPSGFLAAGLFADVVSRLVRGGSIGSRNWNALRGGLLPGAIAESREVLLGYEDNEEVLESVDMAVELYMSDASLDIGYETLGEGWVAEEALGIALFSALNFPEDFSEGVLASVNITGDSDTTGCLTGALLGASLGLTAVPGDWQVRLEHRAELMELAAQIFELYLQPSKEDD